MLSGLILLGLGAERGEAVRRRAKGTGKDEGARREDTRVKENERALHAELWVSQPDSLSILEQRSGL